MSSATLPSFSAFYAHKRAVRSAARLCAGKTDSIPCRSCAGTGQMKSEMTTISAEGRSTSTSTMSCFFCLGKGTADPFKQTYSSLVWCNCKNKTTSHFIHAADGRRVFGNDTYLCSSCGFVKQFG